MIIICPTCAAKFVVNAQQLGGGRTVRCGKCFVTWHQEPQSEPQADDVLTPEEAREYPVSNQMPMLRPKRSAKPLWRVAASLAAVLVLALGSVVALKHQVVSIWPPAARLFMALHMPVPAPGMGLKFSNLAAVPGLDEDGQIQVLVTGRVENTAGASQDLPNLRFSLLDANRRSLQATIFGFETAQLLPGTFVDFYHVLHVQNQMATKLGVQFAAPTAAASLPPAAEAGH